MLPLRSETAATPSAYGQGGSVHTKLFESKILDALTTKSGLPPDENMHLYEDASAVVSKPVPDNVTELPPAASP